MSQPINLTIQNAPRNATELLLCGRFSLKTFALSIGLGDTPEKRGHIAQLSVEGLVEDIIAFLTEYDKTHGAPAAPVPAPAPAATPAAAPPAVAAPAMAAPPAAAAPAAPSGRKPRNSAAQAAAAAAPAAPVAAAPSVAGADVAPALQQVIALMEATRSQLAQQAQDHADLLGAMKAQSAFMQTMIATQNAQQSETMQCLNLAMALTLMLSEESLGGARPAILQAAIDDIPSIEEMVGKALKG